MSASRTSTTAPSARPPRERVVDRLSFALTTALTDGLEVFTVAPLLVVEVLSPSTRRRDLAEQRDIYAESGVASYWVADPRG